MDIQQIIEAIRRDRVRITDHADEEAQADRLSYDRPDPTRWIDWHTRRPTQ